jgi:hypothetical protein
VIRAVFIGSFRKRRVYFFVQGIQRLPAVVFARRTMIGRFQNRHVIQPSNLTERRGSRMGVLLLAILGFSLPFSDFPFFIWKGFGVDLSHVAGGVFLLWCLFRRLKQPGPETDPVLVTAAAALLVIPLGAFAFVRLPGFEAAAFWKTYFHLAFLLAVFLGLVSVDLDRKRLIGVLAFLGAEGAVLAGYGIYQVIAIPRHWPSGLDFLNRHAWHPLRAQGIVWRATAILEEPKWLTIYLLPAIPYLYGAALASARARRPGRLFSIIAGIALVLAGILATGSLGGIPAALLLVLLCGVDYFRHVRHGVWRRALLAGTAIALLLLLGFLLFSSPSLQFLGRRVTTELTETVNGARSDYSSTFLYVENLRYALAIFRESPLVGAGVGQFAPVGQIRGRELGFSKESNRDGPWIGFGGLLAETGLLGILAVAAIAFQISSWTRLGGEPQRDDRIIANLLVLSVLLKEFYSGFYVHFWTWFPLGIAGCLARGARERDAAGR